jgi:hypothetical protein
MCRHSTMIFTHPHQRRNYRAQNRHQSLLMSHPIKLNISGSAAHSTAAADAHPAHVAQRPCIRAVEQAWRHECALRLPRLHVGAADTLFNLTCSNCRETLAFCSTSAIDLAAALHTL